MLSCTFTLNVFQQRLLIKSIMLVVMIWREKDSDTKPSLSEACYSLSQMKEASLAKL